MESNLNINELIELKQMPVIFYQLETIGKEIEKHIADVGKMECTEENKQEVKKRRTEINNLTKIMEDKRKEIKKRILADYEVFNEKYEAEIKSKLLYASNELANKINEIEYAQKSKKEEELLRFAEEHIKFNNLESIVEAKDVLPTITLSASEKSLKDVIMGQIGRISLEVRLIKEEDYSDEVLLEYKKSFSYVDAKGIVLERHKELEQIAENAKIMEIKEEHYEKITKEIEEIIAPVEIKEEQIVSSTFTVKTTVENLKKIKAFLEELGVEYE